MNELPRHFIILADESAGWQLAGLRQIDRLLLALNECAAAANTRSRVSLFWRPLAIRETTPRSLPHLQVEPDASAEAIRQLLAEEPPSVVILPTKLVVGRRVLGPLIAAKPATGPIWIPEQAMPCSTAPEGLWAELAGRFTLPSRSVVGEGIGHWELVQSHADLPRGEKNLLLSTRKAVDGFVSRHLNRPVSRSVSRFLVKTTITPNQWTALITTLAVPCFWSLSRGDYLGFVVGAFLYHLNSVLDGCDGEIARLKYLDSKTGDAVDGMCDFFINLIYVLGVGVGLSRQAGISETQGAIYFWEGMTLGACSVATEGLSSLFSNSPAAQIVVGHVQKLPVIGRLFRRRTCAANTALAPSVERFLQPLANFLIRMTKRDVYAFAFVGLAVIGQTQWSLHFIVVVVIARFLALFAANPAWSPENSGWRS